MKNIRIVLVTGISLLCSCAFTCKNSTEVKKTQEKEGYTAEEVMDNPYGKYTLETADVQVWFYDKGYVYFDREEKAVRNYKTIDTDSK
ncbi:MAG: hypothetical protein PHI44_01125 [Candidatus Ratteibacteria bacterium]|nr:hypothetical protein [Candidatus Ratteibacteria bacterium]